jgi:uncharacterized protein (TIGR03032 family)
LASCGCHSRVSRPSRRRQVGSVATFWLQTSRQFPNFLAEHHASLAVTAYQAGKLFLLGVQSDGRVSVFERTLERCMGMCATSATLHIATLYQIWRFQNMPALGSFHQNHDALFSPRRSWVTGNLDAHDIALGTDRHPVFANTLFSCIVAVSDTHSLVPLW